MEEVIAAEAYLELFLRRLTESSLIGLFLRFIVASTDESESVLSSLITRLSANSTVSYFTGLLLLVHFGALFDLT